ncbi:MULTISPECIES: adenosylcobinamide-phosphate synthase CbiB [unclassified Novosphingobium]|uniref:adenosylcobinamide-phosphate synthase CbiB n=1 Tax=unclassified Novosphingobium TaxID=2644732 RepID=UPI001494D42E|nr:MULTISPECIES: adenosylcobinamide-phosphate synthase CbiB [unclassified Novosphingobium]MBB3358780.1 adenosylcobinamide-phosphate synthase [Novosphingobium sp. BK256]MBB3375141.1 adenosylcobinamide-phosphate synthase [Novosphingobium sp. BK280]MBB3379171.1 adenosylcobinamide-phosphate synthase [Novosphingobium sp. BK258]MBB3420865.1 adenosylcobinamide-phosphate synthase [Novosphingobium sp. BK267]MBB3449562.1 adenosylcobinamide-phosphate synthase [Novosphingobium sp. BK352]
MVETLAALALALALDLALGWPAALYARLGHPVGGFARVIGWCARLGNRPQWSAGRRRAMGVVTVLVLLAVAIGLAGALQALATWLAGGWAWIVIGLLAWPGLALRSLHDHVRPVALALARDDLAGARRAVAMIVGRDTATLDRAGVARAAIESLAESFCDGVAAPLFWMVLAGLPGLWAYKAINTADSLIGHREAPWGPFGWAAARLDDALNLLPARLGAVLLCLAGGGGWAVLWRDHGRHASPNAGWTEAAMAGALGLRLAGPVVYDGVAVAKDWIGQGRAAADARDVARALRLYRRACALLIAVALGAVVVLKG